VFIYLVLYINLKTLTLGNIVVNTLLHKLLSNMYLSKYTSVSHCCQCLNPHIMFVNYHCQTNGHDLSLYVSTRTRQLSIQPDTSYSNRSMPNQWAQSCQLSMSTWTQACNPMGTISACMFQQISISQLSKRSLNID